MEQQPRSVGSGVYHGADIEVTKTVALESGESVSGVYIEAGQVSVVASVHAKIGKEEFAFHLGWTPDEARRLGELLIRQADLIDSD